MRKAAAKLTAGTLFFILMFCFQTLLQAQDDPSIETDWDNYSYDIYARGDQTFLISFGVIFPTIFINQGIINNDGWKTLGGTGTLIFNYYLNPKLFIGGEVSGIFIPTIGDGTVFIVPFGARVGTQFIFDRFEFPISATVGGALQSFLNHRYFGLNVKVSGSALFRATNQWAFGLTTGWSFLPQWTGNKYENVLGNFLDINLTARYHF